MMLKRLFSSRLAVVAGAVLGSFFLLSSVAQADVIVPIVNTTIAGPIGGFQVCVDATCKTVNGVENVNIFAGLDLTSLTVPTVTTSLVPACGNVGFSVTVTTLGATGSLVASVSYQPVDPNGNDVGSPVVVTLPVVPINVVSQTHTISVCGDLLGP